mmetsp:Transcript_20890/g.46686  ORF Transcript_20890/g.46686 Transcript_20890/m.46686 type:complete len:230 (+) Transcript_20890:759-1448(+)
MARPEAALSRQVCGLAAWWEVCCLAALCEVCGLAALPRPACWTKESSTEHDLPRRAEALRPSTAQPRWLTHDSQRPTAPQRPLEVQRRWPTHAGTDSVFCCDLLAKWLSSCFLAYHHLSGGWALSCCCAQVLPHEPGRTAALGNTHSLVESDQHRGPGVAATSCDHPERTARPCLGAPVATQHHRAWLLSCFLAYHQSGRLLSCCLQADRLTAHFLASCHLSGRRLLSF